MLRRRRSTGVVASAAAAAAAIASSSHPLVSSASLSLDELRRSLDRLEYLIAKISPSPPPSSVPPLCSEPAANESQKEDVDATTTNIQIREKNDNVVDDVRFMRVESNDENEIIELLRRIAEIVVLCERRAGQLLAYAAAVGGGVFHYRSHQQQLCHHYCYCYH